MVVFIMVLVKRFIFVKLYVKNILKKLINFDFNIIIRFCFITVDKRICFKTICGLMY